MLELSSNLLIPHTFACLLGFKLCSKPRDHFLGSGKRVNTVSEGCSEKFHKIIVMMEHLLSKVADLQPETF